MSAAVLCVAFQYLAKRFLEDPRQYGYVRDLALAGAWALLAVWFGSPMSRFVVAAAFLSGCVGLAEGLWPERFWKWGYLLTGLLCALFGPGIKFISFVDGEYIYLTPMVSVGVTTLWFAVFPLIIQQLDAISGLAGHVLAVTFSLMLMSVVLSGQGMQDAFFMSFAGLVLLGAFWSRFSNLYRQAGRALSALWGTLVAGTAILGVSKGIVFSSMLYLSLGLFAIPLAEVSMRLVGFVLTDSPRGPEMLYRKLIRRGLDHPDAVRLIACLCAFLGIASALSEFPKKYVTGVWAAGLFVTAVVFMLPMILKYRKKSRVIGKKTRLWGISVDNVSMNYALARTKGYILSGGAEDGARLVATVNALGMEEAVRDREYHRILRKASLVLSDGVGLLWGLRFLGMPIQERVAGIDFADQLCRMAAAEGWPIYFLGARGNTAQKCARAMARRYPGLIVAGARDGYFNMEDGTVAQRVAESGARILFVAMGIPRQEKWVARHSITLSGLLAVGIGGAFDVFSGQLNRAPRLMQKMGMEWFYRLCQEPGRWKKDLRLAVFVLRVLATRLGLYVWKGDVR